MQQMLLRRPGGRRPRSGRARLRLVDEPEVAAVLLTDRQRLLVHRLGPTASTAIPQVRLVRVEALAGRREAGVLHALESVERPREPD